MNENIKAFGDTASKLARNPLGIIALFQVLIYGIAGFVASRIDSANTLVLVPLVWFLVVFPLVVIAVFTYLVIWHHNKLYAPADYANEENFMKGVSTRPRYTAEELLKSQAAIENPISQEHQS
jgi:hypothetical protein